MLSEDSFLSRFNFIAVDARRFSRLAVKASSSEEGSGSVQVEELFSDLKEKVREKFR